MIEPRPFRIDSLLSDTCVEAMPVPATPANGKRPHQAEDRSARLDPQGAAGDRRIEIVDYIELGRAIVDWTCAPQTRPRTVAELAAQLHGVARLPENIKRVVFVESEPETLVIRLPERELTAATFDAMEAPLVGEPYALPRFYDDIYHRRFGPVLSPLETFLARIGDTTIAQCR